MFNLGILGDEKTHKYPVYRAYIGISHKGTLGSGYIQLSPEQRSNDNLGGVQGKNVVGNIGKMWLKLSCKILIGI